MAKAHVTTTINGDEYEFLCEPQQSLVDVLRNELRLSGTKEGCSTGDCGACSVMMDGRLVCSCLVLAVEAEGKEWKPSKVWGPQMISIHCKNDFWRSTDCNVESARPGF